MLISWMINSQYLDEPLALTCWWLVMSAEQWRWFRLQRLTLDTWHCDLNALMVGNSLHINWRYKQSLSVSWSVVDSEHWIHMWHARVRHTGSSSSLWASTAKTTTHTAHNGLVFTHTAWVPGYSSYCPNDNHYPYLGLEWVANTQHTWGAHGSTHVIHTCDTHMGSTWEHTQGLVHLVFLWVSTA